ncbi:MAG: hypothetical protein WCA85_26070 [Paraburkholderia sp.]|uniref:hypothetical protein n=1 Tax=Paraburkholderia sp. TaxID=1926495 RepID=UPI003C4C552C
MKLGKLPARHDPRVPHLSRHMMVGVPKPAVDWTGAVKSWPMLANDVHGDCTAAAAYHISQLWRANSSLDAWQPTDQEALALYSATSGFPKVDEGAVEMDVLRYWSTFGIGTDIGTETIAFTSLNPQNLDELKLSIQWFGAAYLGVALPLSAQTQTEWDVVAGADSLTAPGSWGGHAVCAVAYDETSFTVVTWGALKKVTPAFMQKYLDEAYAVVSRDWLADSGISPPGLDWAALTRDMEAIQV